jgi:aspartate/methionine/tyrosine aminotransferase
MIAGRALLKDYPFYRLNRLLEGLAAGAPSPAMQAASIHEPLMMSLGEPQNGPPAFIRAIIDQSFDLWGRYPPSNGSIELRQAIVDNLNRRYHLPTGWLGERQNILPMPGIREGLFLIALAAVEGVDAAEAPYVLIPNPFYQPYGAGAVYAGARGVFLSASPANGFLPDYAGLDPAILRRTQLAYVCNPGNPHGAVAPRAYLHQLLELAIRYNFLLVVDECYAEIYPDQPPISMLQICAERGDESLNQVAVFQTLSKRSSVPGLRSGFMAAGQAMTQEMVRLISHGGNYVQGPVSAASILLWQDEGHVEANRALYRENLAIAAEIFAGYAGFHPIQAGFFLWLAVGDDEDFARRLWQEAGIKVLPGRYLGRSDSDPLTGQDLPNPGEGFIRIALVHPPSITRPALHRIAGLLGC